MGIYMTAPAITNPGDVYDFDADNDTNNDYVVVDCDLGNVGSWADISFLGNDPVISYMDVSMTGTLAGLKVARELSPGNWEASTAPLSTSVESERLSIEGLPSGAPALPADEEV